jgi:hypothetical protein
LDRASKSRIYKEIYYKLESIKFDIFIDESTDVLTIARNVCSKCFQKWHQDYNQCIFCGSVNYFVFKCIKCGGISSITSNKLDCKKTAIDESGNEILKPVLNKKTKKQVIARDTKLPKFEPVFCNGQGKKSCINPNCLSNTQEYKHLINSITDDKGLFNSKKGSLSISQMWCLHCGNNLDHYFTAQIKVYICDELTELPNKIDPSSDFYIITVKGNKFLSFKKEDLTTLNITNIDNYSNELQTTLFNPI